MIACDCLARVARRFNDAGLHYGHGTENANDEAWWLMHHVLFGSGDFQEIPQEYELSSEQLHTVKELADERISSRQPLAYLLGQAWFCSLPFDVSPDVLVPRSPIAELIQSGFDAILTKPPSRILDLCTGSGCIGIATAMAFPEAEVVISDVSSKALEVARRNIIRHGVGDRVKALESDLFASIEGKFDLILTNPPYVSRTEYELLPHEYHREPSLGLLTDKDGLDIPLRILEQAGSYLTKHGMLILEVGDTWQALNEARPELPFLWLEFSNGGHGVCTLKAAEL